MVRMMQRIRRSTPSIQRLPRSYIFSHRSFTSTSSDTASVLTREYIYGALYARDAGYFTTQEREVLHAPVEPINFTNLWGSMEYRKVVAELYNVKREAWLTPVEVF